MSTGSSDWVNFREETYYRTLRAATEIQHQESKSQKPGHARVTFLTREAYCLVVKIMGIKKEGVKRQLFPLVGWWGCPIPPSHREVASSDPLLPASLDTPTKAKEASRRA